MTDDVTPTCQICGRVLKAPCDCGPDDPAMDCGGDCFACIQGLED